jgi:hypothetical protein
MVVIARSDGAKNPEMPIQFIVFIPKTKEVRSGTDNCKGLRIRLIRLCEVSKFSEIHILVAILLLVVILLLINLTSSRRKIRCMRQTTSIFKSGNDIATVAQVGLISN